MLAETSKARITVPSRRGCGTVASGRARPVDQHAPARAAAAPAAACAPPSRSSSRAGRPARARPAARAAPPDRAAACGTRAPRAGRRRARAASTARRSVIARRRLRSWEIRNSARTRSSSVDTVNRSSPADRRSATSVACRSSACCAQALLEAGVVGVDEDDLAGLGVLDVDHPGGGQLELAPVDHLDRHDVVAAGELAEQALPARLGEEVRDDHDERAAPQDPQRGAQRGPEVGGPPARRLAARPACSREDAQHVVAAVAGRDRLPHAPRRRTARRPGCRRGTAAAPPWPRPR